jgi:hypothetical protein
VAIASTAVGTAAATTFNTFCIGGLLRSSFALSFGGLTGLVLIHNRALSAQEVASLAANPWQLFKAPQRTLPPTVHATLTKTLGALTVVGLVKKTVGSAVGRDYATIQAALDSLPASAITAGNSYVLELYNDSLFVENVSWSAGTGWDAAHTLTIRAAPGHGFNSNAAVRSNRLAFDQAHGVAVTGATANLSVLDFYGDNLTVDGIQFQTAGNTDVVAVYTDRQTTFSNCLIAHTGPPSTTPNEVAYIASGGTVVADNCIIIGDNDYCAAYLEGTDGVTATNCLAVNPSNRATGSYGFVFDDDGSLAGGLLVQNCAAFGYTTSFRNYSANSASIHAASGHNATDTSSLGGFAGSGSLVSQVYANQFVQPSDAGAVEDFRLKTGASLIDAGLTLSGADISGAVRGTAWDIGPWEYVPTITKTVGTAGRDYATIQAALDSLPASAITAGNSYVLELYNDSLFVQNIRWQAAMATDASHTLTIRAAPGHSFRDHPSVRTNRLAFNQAYGVALDGLDPASDTFDVQANYLFVDGLQIRSSGQYVGALYGESLVDVTNCLFDGQNAIYIGGTAAVVVDNCVAIGSDTGFDVETSVSLSVTNCLAVNPSNRATAAYDAFYLADIGALSGHPVSGSLLVQNCAAFGFANAFNNGSGDSVSINSASGHNATDGSSVGGFGTTGNLVSQTYADQFVQPSDASGLADFRLKTGATLIDAGGSASATDISGLARPQGTASDIGPWEYQAASGISADLAKTLGTATASATAAVSVGASLARTLGTATLAAAATLTDAGALTTTLGTAGASSTASVTVAASSSATLGAVTLAATAAVTVAAAASPTLAAASSTASGALAVAAAASLTLGTAQLGSAAALTDSAALAKTLGAASLAADGAVGAMGRLATLDATLGAATLTSAASAAVGATLAAALSPAALSAAATSSVGAAFTSALGTATSSAAVLLPIAAAASGALGLNLSAGATLPVGAQATSTLAAASVVAAAGAVAGISLAVRLAPTACVAYGSADQAPFVAPPLLRAAGLLCVARRPYVDRLMRRKAP